MNSRQILLLVIGIGLSIYLVYYTIVSFDYHGEFNPPLISLQGEQFNWSTSYGSFQLSPEAQGSFIASCFMFLMIFFALAMFTLGGGWKLLNQEKKVPRT